MTTIKAVAKEFDGMVPAIAENAQGFITRQLTRLLANYDMAGLRKLSSSWSYDGGTWRQFRHFCDMVDENGQRTGNFNRGTYAINPERIAKHAEQYAQAQVDSFKAKLETKLQDLTDVEDLRIGGLEFTFRGRLGEHRVFVEQSTVLKQSNKGTLFNQWPCRIYVDGKFMSAAKFKKLAA